MRMNRPKKSSSRPRRAARAMRRLKKSAVRNGSTRLALATSVLAVAAMIFLGATAALLTAREDVQHEPVTYKATPAPRTVTKDIARPLATAQTVAAETQRPVTIAGCLENDEGTFILTDATGTNAPASRSWKSGFLKKRAASIELSDQAGTLKLRQHVGRRISATGTLVDREMRALSIRRIGSCD